MSHKTIKLLAQYLQKPLDQFFKDNDVQRILSEETSLSKTVAALGSRRIANTMLAVNFGNSIALQNNLTNTSAASELWMSNHLAGAPLRFKTVTQTTRTDKYGCYGYSGQSLATMITDMDVQWFTPLYNAGLVPDIVIGDALLENDLVQARTVTQMKSSLTSWLRNVQNRWPGVIVQLCTPRPSAYAIVSDYQSIRDYILSLDNGRDIFVSRCDVHESLVDVGRPNYINLTGSISGNVLTVTNITGGALRQGMYIQSGIAGTQYGFISYFGTGTGGVGTYILSASNTVASSSMVAMTHTQDGIHPNFRGALALARVKAATLQRIATVWKSSFLSLSGNLILEGSGAASGTNVSGTWSTGASFSGSLAAANSVFVAEQPGLKVTYNVNPVVGSASGNPLGLIGLGSLAVSGVTSISPFAKIEIISGAENIKNIELQPRINDGSGNTFQVIRSTTTNDTEPDFQNGDILTIKYPPLVATSGSITALQNYISAVAKLGGGSFSFRVIAQGFHVIS